MIEPPHRSSKMPISQQFTRVDFFRFKAFSSFSLQLRRFNILVGANNAGKSTILTAFRILAAAMRRANNRRAETVRGPHGRVPGYVVDLRSISVAEENIFFDYEESEAASVTFTLANNNRLQLYFPEVGACYLIPDAQGRQIITPVGFKSQFHCPIGFVPILGPVEHDEKLYDKEAARLALFNYQAARNFRNIWYHYPEEFPLFRETLRRTWPGMDIESPVIDPTPGKPRLHMFCPEDRRPREIFWAGFGFQVWCQMLTHLIQSDDASLFLIDEPDIYLHSELQRQLLGLLRNLGPDILIATHSTEIISEAETNDIVLIHKRRKSAKRIKNPTELQEIFSILGSNLNPTLTQIAKTRRVLFLEGHDFQIVGRFARKLGHDRIGNRSDFAIVPLEGFNPERARSLKAGMERTLGARIASAVILDRDYRCESECETVVAKCRDFCSPILIHGCKEIENFLLVPSALDRAAERKAADKVRRTGAQGNYSGDARSFLFEFAQAKKSYVFSQCLSNSRQFTRNTSAHVNDTTIMERGLRDLECRWMDPEVRLSMIPGKEALRAFNEYLQTNFDLSLTPAGIIDAMQLDEIPKEMTALVAEIASFCSIGPEPNDHAQG